MPEYSRVCALSYSHILPFALSGIPLAEPTFWASEVKVDEDAVSADYRMNPDIVQWSQVRMNRERQLSESTPMLKMDHFGINH